MPRNINTYRLVIKYLSFDLDTLLIIKDLIDSYKTYILSSISIHLFLSYLIFYISFIHMTINASLINKEKKNSKRSFFTALYLRKEVKEEVGGKEKKSTRMKLAKKRHYYQQVDDKREIIKL